MAFKFSFQKVLDVKEKEKEFAQQEFGTAKTRQLELEEQLNELELQKQQIFLKYDETNRKTVSELVEMQHDIEHVNRKMKQLEVKSQQVQVEVETKQQVLISKLQEAKMWNQWKQKSFAAFQKDMQQKEQAMLDEMAVLRYSHKV
ncbi:flagellar export protein FliJ [Bacillus rubiinfantis]|uniref:flagellar export protein FliJ n=1 Tax=Bacillus rubiinfantis TaxID=1499680 RepID=UPI0005AA9517|nr:flagellar export protein FliJ [Bacillus rubiinfantis]